MLSFPYIINIYNRPISALQCFCAIIYSIYLKSSQVLLYFSGRQAFSIYKHLVITITFLILTKYHFKAFIDMLTSFQFKENFDKYLRRYLKLTYMISTWQINSSKTFLILVRKEKELLFSQMLKSNISECS